ncbi:MAG: hypothetical protein WCG80_18935 [Spirochaetales bacterium]
MTTPRPVLALATLVCFLGGCASLPDRPPQPTVQELPTGDWTAVALTSDAATEVQARLTVVLGSELPAGEAPVVRALYRQVVAGTNFRALVAWRQDKTWVFRTVELYQSLDGNWP